MFGGIMDVLGGGGDSGYGDIQNQLQKAMDAIKDSYSKGRAGYDPYAQAGTGAIGNYQNSLNQMSDPFGYADKIGQNYQQSAQAKNNINAITSSMNNAAAASGMAGTPAMQEALAGKVNDISNADQQQYFNNIMGVNNQYQQGQNNMMGYGMNAQNGINQNYMGEGNALAGLYGDMGNAQLGQQQSKAGAWGNLIGGGAGLISSLF